MQMSKTFFFTKKRSMFILKHILLPILFIHLSLGVIATIRNAFIKNDEYGAIFISDYAITKYDFWASPLACFGAYPYWTYYLNNRGMKARWILRAYSQDLERVIRDQKCQSIILVGHGTFNSWQAVDALVTNEHVAKWMRGIPKKKGEWLQLTCGVSDRWSLKMGELVMDRERVYTYNESVNTYIFITDAIFGFKYLKSLKEK